MPERIPFLIDRIIAVEQGQHRIMVLIDEARRENRKEFEQMASNITNSRLAIAKMQAASHTLYLGILAIGGLVGFLGNIAVRVLFIH